MGAQLILGAKRVLKYIWCSPTTALALLIGLLGVLTRQLACKGFHHGVFKFVMTQDSWLQRHYKLWGATTIGTCIFFVDDWHHGSDAMWAHEHGHVEQALRLGPFYLPVYLGIWVCIKWACPNLSAYLHHPMEADARAYSELMLQRRVEL